MEKKLLLIFSLFFLSTISQTGLSVCEPKEKHNLEGLKGWRLTQKKKENDYIDSKIYSLEKLICKLEENLDYEEGNAIFKKKNNLHGMVGLIEIKPTKGMKRHPNNIPKVLAILAKKTRLTTLEAATKSKFADELQSLTASLRIQLGRVDHMKTQLNNAYEAIRKSKSVPKEVVTSMEQALEEIPDYIQMVKSTWKLKTGRDLN